MWGVKTVRSAQAIFPDLVRWNANPEQEEARILHLIERGADINAQDEKGNTPLHLAAASGTSELADLFLSHGANVGLRNNAGETPLLKLRVNIGQLISDPQREAARVIGLIETLLRSGADINEQSSLLWRTVLHHLADYKFDAPPVRGVTDAYEKIIRRVLELGADANAKDSAEYTPLHMIKSYDVCTRLLVEYGARIDEKDCDGCTPLLDAIFNCSWEGFVEHGGAEQLRLLVELGADVNHRDDIGRTPLHFAVNAVLEQDSLGKQDEVQSMLAILCWLVQMGAEISAKTNSGRTALDMAKRELEVGQAGLLKKIEQALMGKS